MLLTSALRAVLHVGVFPQFVPCQLKNLPHEQEIKGTSSKENTPRSMFCWGQGVEDTVHFKINSITEFGPNSLSSGILFTCMVVCSAYEGREGLPETNHLEGGINPVSSVQSQIQKTHGICVQKLLTNHFCF